MTKNATTAATHKRGSWLVRQLRRTELEQRPGELAQSIRQSETLAKAGSKVEQLATDARALDIGPKMLWGLAGGQWF
jgi:hypothetical protein